MRIDFHFDPTCPWCWVTSRWLVDVRTRRDLRIRWRPFSLKIKNEDVDVPERFRASADLGLRALRVSVALADAGGSEAVGALYGELGRRIHLQGQTDVDLADAFVAVGFDPQLADAQSDESLDAVIRDSMKAVLDLAGDDVGVPIIEFEVGGARRAIYGPIIGAAVRGHEADELFEHVMALASSETFFELKRSRSGPPQIGTSG